MSEAVELAFVTDDLQLLSDLCREHRPDVILLDYDLGSFTGIDALKLIHPRYPDSKVLMFTVMSEDENIFSAITCGASGYLLKSTPLPEIEAAVLEAHQGGSPLTPKIATRVLDLFRRSNLSQQPLKSLTVRENEILKALSEGMAYKQVASELNISLGTVRTHIENIYKKLEVNSKAGAVAMYLRHNR
ncbi:MAG: response regulator transcription factor [Hymenobacteraceae bacterium]|nr:response regulator transcription factor [Hymenobacteraceae bacterium]